MMQIVKYPERNEWKQLLSRPFFDSSALEKSVKRIIEDVKKSGDKALRKYTAKFDGVRLKKFKVTEKEIIRAGEIISRDLKGAIELARKNIEKFHGEQLQSEEVIETMPGIRCWRKSVAIEKVGLYIPGGTAPLFSTILMLGIPAILAGCKEIVLCSPPDKEGNLHPAILYTAHIAGITTIFKAGGVQAIAAMAYGTETVPNVHKIFGPGNQYVTYAKMLVQKEGIAIDMPAGPSEVAIYADDNAEPAFIAADLLSQAEHGIDSQVLLVLTNSKNSGNSDLIDECLDEIELQLEKLPRKEIAGKALANSRFIVVNSEEDAIALLNEYAPEHLILNCENAGLVAEKIVNAGSVFLGEFSPESVGDYASGTNHTLPTNGFAKAYSGVSIDSFVKKITFQQLDQQGLKNIGKAVELMAEAEGLTGHAEAVRVRLR
jgi:histidinol dehydrogenase